MKQHNLNFGVLIVSKGTLTQLLWTTAAIRALRFCYPKAYFTALTNLCGQEVLKNTPHLNATLRLIPFSLLFWISFFLALKKNNVTTALFFHKPSKLTRKLCTWMGISNILETGASSLLECLQMIEKLGVKFFDARMEIFVPKKEPLPFFHSYIPLIGIYPAARKKFHQWKIQDFIDLGNKLYAHFGCQILVLGTPEEAPLVHKITSFIEGAISITQPLSLHEMSLLIQKMSLFIVNSPDPFHLATALQTPTLAILGHSDPVFLSPHFFYEATVLQNSQTCFPCLNHKCQEPFYMRQISVEKVFNHALKIFYHLPDKEKILNNIG